MSSANFKVLNQKEQLWHRAVSLREHGFGLGVFGFLVINNFNMCNGQVHVYVLTVSLRLRVNNTLPEVDF